MSVSQKRYFFNDSVQISVKC